MTVPTNPQSFVRRMIEALAAIDKLVAPEAAVNPLLSLAPEIVVERVRAHLELHKRLRAEHARQQRMMSDYRAATTVRADSIAVVAFDECPRCRGRGISASGAACLYCMGHTEDVPR